MKKARLYTPGPTMVPELVSLDMAAPIIHHRTEEFSEILEFCQSKLQELYQTKNPVLMLTSSGTGAMEGAVSSVLSTSTPTLVVRGGKFGERWGELCDVYRVPWRPLDVTWGESVTPERVKAALDEFPETKAVCFTHSETSTGALTDVKAITKVVKDHGALAIVDTITGLGVHELRFDAWGVDVAVSGSQKGLMLPPGLAFAAVSDDAWKAVAQSDLANYYLSYAQHRKAWEKKTTPWTPAITLFIGLASALDLLLEDGLDALWARHVRLADAMRAAVRRLGLAVFPRVPANIQTVVSLPSELSYKTLSKALEETYGMKVAGGQDELAGKIIRIAHFGYVDEGDLIAAVGFLERALAEQNWKVNFGEAIAAAQQVLAQG